MTAKLLSNVALNIYTKATKQAHINITYSVLC